MGKQKSASSFLVPMVSANFGPTASFYLVSGTLLLLSQGKDVDIFENKEGSTVFGKQ